MVVENLAGHGVDGGGDLITILLRYSGKAFTLREISETRFTLAP